MKQTFIGSQMGGADFLSRLTIEVGNAFGYKMKQLDATVMNDSSDAVYWMFMYDAHEQRIYKIQGGTRQFVDIDADGGVFDIDDARNQIKTAILQLASS